MIFQFLNAENSLAGLTGGEVAALLAAAADVVLVLDAKGIVVDLAYDLENASALDIANWRGRPCADLVEAGSRGALRKMLNAAVARRHSLRQMLRHVSPSADEFAVVYVALPLGQAGQVVLLGRDQRELNALQSRLLVERLDYERRRREQQRDDARYRQLFELSSEAQLLVDTATGLVREANAQAAAMLRIDATQLRGQKLVRLFERGQRAELQALLDNMLLVPSAMQLELSAELSRAELRLLAEPTRGDERGQLLVRLHVARPSPPSSPTVDGLLAAMLRDTAQAVVLTDTRGDIVWSNARFLTMLGGPEAASLAGEALSDWLELRPLELSMLLGNLRRYSSEQNLQGVLHTARKQALEVEVSVTALLDETPPGVGFILRKLEAAPKPGATRDVELFQSAEQLTELVGKVPLKGMVRDATDKVEKMCIEAALRLTGNNRALAAKVLGMSRQGLYQKLHQFNLADGDEPDGDTPRED